MNAIIKMLKPFRGTRLNYIRKNLPTRSETEYNTLQRGKNGVVFDNFVSMLNDGSYNLITIKGPDFGKYELKLTTFKEDCNLKGDISICDIKDESWNDSNFKKKIEYLIIAICIGKNGRDDQTCCFVDILILNENLRDRFLNEVSKSYKFQRERCLRGRTSGVRGLLKLDNKNLKLTGKAVKHFFVSSYEENPIGTSKLLLGLEQKSSGVFNSFANWLKIYRNPISLKEFSDLLNATAGYKQMTGQLDVVRTIRPGDTWRNSDSIYSYIINKDGESVLREARPGVFKEEIQNKEDFKGFL